MTRAELEHVIRAAADIAVDDEIIVIGSQAILAQFPDAPAALRVSVEADVFPKNHPERADLIDGSIGEGSPFHAAYGYYAQGVSETTAVLPAGWKDRLVPVCNANTRGSTAWCLEVHDLVLSKAFAGRDKDSAFIKEAVAHGLVDEAILVDRLAALPVPARDRERLRELLVAWFRAAPRTVG